MCSHGDTVDVAVTIDWSLSFEGVSVVKNKPIDRCIAPIVAALEAAGIYMYSSCCGHYQSDGEILLVDGRVLRIIDPKDRDD
jgi:hypothetical protein